MVLVSIFPVGFGMWMALSRCEIGTLMHVSGLQARDSQETMRDEPVDHEISFSANENMSPE
jgi:hypothetical protein